MGKLIYDGQQWIGWGEDLLVKMSDATYQKHLHAYLQNKGVPTLTLLQLREYEAWVLEQRHLAGEHLSNLETWRDCDDPDVSVRKL